MRDLVSKQNKYFQRLKSDSICDKNHVLLTVIIIYYVGSMTQLMVTCLSLSGGLVKKVSQTPEPSREVVDRKEG